MPADSKTTAIATGREETAPSGLDAMVSASGTERSVSTGDDGSETGGIRSATVWTSTPEFEDGETGYPLLRLAQGLTPEVTEGTAKMGDLLLNGYDPMKVVTFVPMFFARTRRRNDPEDRMKALCTSGDGVTGTGDPGGTCKACPFAQWTENQKTGKRQRPQCDLTFNYGGYSEEHGQLVQLGFKGTATGAANTINNLVVANRGMGKFAIKLTSKQERSGPNIYAVPVVTTTKMKPDTMLAVREILNPSYVEVDPDDVPEDAISVESSAV